MYFIREKGMQSRKLLFHISRPLNFITGTSHFQSCSWADAALEIGVSEVSLRNYLKNGTIGDKVLKKIKKWYEGLNEG